MNNLSASERERRLQQEMAQKKLKRQSRKSWPCKPAKERKEKPNKGQKIAIKQSIQSFLPIKEIRHGIVITKDNRYIKILEFSPINFLLRSAKEQDAIVMSFAGMLKKSPNKLQFKSITRKADVEKFIDTLHAEIKQETNVQCKQLQIEHIDLIKEVGLEGGVSRRFFIVFEYEPYNINKKSTFDDVFGQLTTLSNRIIGSMKQCGNEFVSPYEDKDEEDKYYMEIFYELLNRKASEEMTFDDRIEDTINRYIVNNIDFDGLSDTVDVEVPCIPVNDFIGPRVVDLTHWKNMSVDGMYYAFGYIPSLSYTPAVSAGWLSTLVNLGEGVDVDFFLDKVPKDKAQRKIGQQIRINRAKIKDTQDTNTNFDDLENAITSGYYLKQGLSNNEDLYYMNTIITITAEDREVLDWKVKEIQTFLLSFDMNMKMCHFQNEQAFLSVLPLCKLDKTIFNKSKRNILTSAAASAYPFTSYEMCDENGILLGVNKSNNSLVVVDIFNSKIYKNANMAILGTSGAGKTFTMQCMALRMRQKQIQVFILAPLKGHEFRRAANSIGGEYIKISAGSQNCINIMEIRKKDSRAHEMLDGGVDDSILSQKIQKLHIFFSLLVPDITHEEKQMLDEVLIKTYFKRGITNDNNSLYINGRDGCYKEMPILGDVHSILVENEHTRRLATILNRYVSGSASSFNKQTNVNLNNKYIVLDISELTNEMLPVGMFIALDYVWDKTKENRTARKAIFLDELWNLIGASSNRMAAEFVLEIFKVIRAYGGSAIAATQDLNDFFALEDGKYGKGIINNAKTKIILNLEQEEADRVRDTLNLTETEAYNIVSFQRGSGLISTNNNNVIVEFKASQLETKLITTDREELEKIVNE